jgi:murein DD-endopeptidase MepM/ murein hydrolase activator NlpD
VKQHTAKIICSFLFIQLVHFGHLNYTVAFELQKSVLPIQLQTSFVAPPFRGDGKVHFVYEVNLSNFRPIDFALVQIDVFDTDHPDTIILQHQGGELNRYLIRPGKGEDEANSEVLHGGEFMIVFMWVTFDEKISLPAAIAHRATFQRVTSSGEKKRYTVEGALVPLPAVSSLVIHPPVRSGLWLLANGPSKLGDHRKFIQVLDGIASNTQRFAGDWMLLGPDGRLAKGELGENQSWYCYGSDILAVADGEVTSVVDGIPENIPLLEERAVPNKREMMSGNYIILKLESGEFAFYGHLQPGSLGVKAGDNVSAGQVIGRIGNSGNSDAPHLHFHVADTNDPLSGQGLPFAFHSFEVMDRMSVSEWEEMLINSRPWVAADGSTISRYEGETPVGEAIIRFH